MKERLMAAIVLVPLITLIAGIAVLLALRARRHEDRYRLLLDQLPNSTVIVFDRDLTIRTVLGAGAQVLVPDKPVGRRLEELFEPQEAATLAKHYRAALGGESRSFDFKRAGTENELAIQAAPLREGGVIVGCVAIAQDVTDQRHAERRLSAEARRRYLILDAMNEAYVANDRDGVVTGWNRAAEQTFGWTAGEAIGRSIYDLIIPESDHEEFQSVMTRERSDAPPSGRYDVRAERRVVHRDGHEFTVELAASMVEIDGETTLHSLMHDISDRKRAEIELRDHASDVEALTTGVAELARSTDAQDARMVICRAARRVAEADIGILFEPETSGTGLRSTAADGADLRGELILFGERAGSVAAFSSRSLVFARQLKDNPVVGQSIFKTTDAASALWVPIQHEDAALGVIAVAWNEPVDELPERLERIMGVISAEAAVAIERAALLERLERMTRTDELTGLTNRRAWDSEVSREVVRAGREQQPLAIAMLDLDRFKLYNDQLGHQAGDRLLKEAAGAWRSVLRETDLLARYGGEEFAVALPGCDSDLATRLVERLRAVTPGGQSCSAGLACWDGEESADDLLGRADAALYEAKQGGRDRTVLA
jgi:diguanylate cyclase (GGDEF)-like protein/PAS domain S-box-containing protein